MRDAVEKCDACKGEGIVVTPAPEPLALCGKCKGSGLQPAAPFRLPLPPAIPSDLAELEAHELAPWSAHFVPLPRGDA